MKWTFVRNDTTGQGWTLQVSKAGGGPGTPLPQQPVLESSDLEQLKAALKDLA